MAAYVWTRHAEMKMRHYGLSESRIKRVIRVPFRHEEGVLEKAIAVMQPNKVTKTEKGRPAEWKEEIWAMYLLVGERQGISNFEFLISKQQRKIKVVTAWRYPGMSKKRDPIPEEILKEVQLLL